MNNKICYIISNLDIGGAELSLQKIVEGLSDKFCFTVITFKKNGILEKKLNDKGFSVISLDIENNFDLLTKLFFLYKIIKKINPKVVHTWMYHADFFGAIVSKIAGVKNIYWNIRNTELISGTSFSTILIARINAILSYFIPNKIIFVSESSKRYHSEIFYSKKKMLVIPNGYDTNFYKFNNFRRKEIRAELNIPFRSLVIGSAGRYNNYKDHNNFIEAAIKILNSINNEIDLRFVLIGRDISSNNLSLYEKIEQNNLTNKFYLLGPKSNIVDYYSAFDIFCLHSKSEGFPNVLAEAMATGLFCVSTDVGDVNLMIKDKRFIVAPENSTYLSKVLIESLKLNKKDLIKLGNENRNTIKKFYSLKKMYKKYIEIYKI